jgi:hypothetical protein
MSLASFIFNVEQVMVPARSLARLEKAPGFGMTPS